MTAESGSPNSSPVILGLWPIAGIATIGVTAGDARQTIAAALRLGITTFDTAFNYGFDGESDRLLGEFVRSERDRFRIISKVGQRWSGDRKRVIDCAPKSLTADAETSLKRIGIDHFDLLMLHCTDPNVPIERSADAFEALRSRGLCERVGVCNVDAGGVRAFASVAECSAIQCPLNLMQRDSLRDLIPHCQSNGYEVFVYWTLMKGLLAGKIDRDHEFHEDDVRPTFEIFQGEARRRTHEVLDGLRSMADLTGISVAQLSIGWALSQKGVTSALVGARRADQLTEVAAARSLSSDLVSAIDELVKRA